MRAAQPGNEDTPPKDTGYRCTACRCRKAPFGAIAHAALLVMLTGLLDSTPATLWVVPT